MGSTRHHSLETGVILVVLGLLFLLDNLGVADFGDVVATWWPLLLVGLGLWMLVGNRGRSSSTRPVAPSETLRDATVLGDEEVVETRVLGSLKIRLDSPSFKKGSLHSTFGDVEVDLTGLKPANRDARLALTAVLGDVRVRIPRGLPVYLVARSNLGGVQVGSQHTAGLNSLLTHRSPDFDQASNRLTIVANTLFGDVLADFVEVSP